MPTPYAPDHATASDILARNCDRLAEANVDGIYTTDADGEFYALELEEFARLADDFGRAMARTGIDAAMGVTWSHTQGVIDRIKASVDAGIPNVHVAFPYFMPLAPSDVERFWEDLAKAVPSARWIHYAHPQCGPSLTGTDYAALAGRFPDQLIGTKLGTADSRVLSEILLHAPNLAHFVVDPTMAVGMGLGAKGCYSYWVNTLPRWHRRYMDVCLSRNWQQAFDYHRKLCLWEVENVRPLAALGHRHGVIGKTLGALTGFLDDSGHTRPPYYPVDTNLQASLQAAFRQWWAEELIEESLPHAVVPNGHIRTWTRQTESETDSRKLKRSM